MSLDEASCQRGTLSNDVSQTVDIALAGPSIVQTGKAKGRLRRAGLRAQAISGGSPTMNRH